MSENCLAGVLNAIADMQSGWAQDTPLDTLRADLEALYCSFDGVPGSSAESMTANGVPVDRVTAPGASTERLVLLLHGGGFSMGSARSHRHLAQWISAATACQVLIPDYRLVPEHTYPAQLEDARAVYDWLLEEGGSPDCIALMGDSAGGGLVLSLLAHLRDAPGSLPACACLMSPWCDLECRGYSYQSLADLDPVATHEMAVAMGQAYVGADGDLRDPLASPIELDFNGFPPLMIQAGNREIFLDDARAVARAASNAGVLVELEEWPGMIHQWHLYAGVLSEAREAISRQAEFLARHLH